MRCYCRIAELLKRYRRAQALLLMIVASGEDYAAKARA
jgi:hypothetical protein